ncbi:hypothetical protein G4B11_009725 [Aspergillus flavus]|nr:hypothetical protein G4B11_009725 [Aspergillus flavus]
MPEVKLPGFGFPLDYHYEFIQIYHLQILQQEDVQLIEKWCTYREILIMRVMNDITDEPEWNRKVFDEAITAKWRSEIVASDKDITPNMIDWIIDEVKWKVDHYLATGHVVVFDPGVVRSDIAISEELENALRDGVRKLEDILTEKDYHPGSGDKVVDLWLPCDVDLLDDGSCAIVSYINNLHPQQNARLYHVIEKIISQVIPLWNTTLTCVGLNYRRIPYNGVEREGSGDDSSEDKQSRQVKTIKVPEPGKFSPPRWNSSKFDLHDEFRDTGLQIIVKLANIELTPEKPEYYGGAWHEGRLLTFPNILQHRVSPFSLADRSMPGHRKILALLLVDPYLPIISSSNVPPQQEKWATERERSIRQALRPLPQELKDMVYDDLDTRYMTMDEAKAFRLELMEERSAAAFEQNENFQNGGFIFV